MKTKLILITMLLLACMIGVAQNLVTNGSFENFTPPCPAYAPNGGITQVIDWKPANMVPGLNYTPTVDLYCGGPNYSGCTPGPVPNAGSDGIAYLGLHTRIYNPYYNESFYQVLSSPLDSGTIYYISFDLMTCQSGQFTQGPSDFCVYLNADTIIPACPPDNPAVVNVGCVPYDSISKTVWKNHFLQFTAPANANVIAFSGAACNVTEVYYYLDNIILTIEPITAAKGNRPQEGYTLFPNPFSTETSLHTEKTYENATLTLYNSIGQQVKKISNISGQTFTLTRGHLPGGLYFVRLTQDNKVIVTDKLVIADE